MYGCTDVRFADGMLMSLHRSSLHRSYRHSLLLAVVFFAFYGIIFSFVNFPDVGRDFRLVTKLSILVNHDYLSLSEFLPGLLMQVFVIALAACVASVITQMAVVVVRDLYFRRNQ